MIAIRLNFRKLYWLISTSILIVSINDTVGCLIWSDSWYYFIAISSNDAENYPQDAPDRMTLTAKENNYPFPYLYDETQAVAQAYDAACTPDIYLFDADLKLIYRGQLDSSRPGNGIPVTGEDLRHALDCLLADKENKAPQKPSMGCNIKWKP